MKPENRLTFASDYMEGAHPLILRRLAETNLVKSAGYGLDEFSESARRKIRAACGVPEAEVFFLAGGTQTNAVMIDALLRPWQGVIAAKSGHISVHEAGAIESGGHKVLALPHRDGKLAAETVRACMEEYLQDDNRDHMVMPGMVYISHPTEYGTLYSLAELRALSDVCRSFRIPLYLDGARLAYALACEENDVSLPDLAKLCDVFYIGGTKCGALLGEAIVAKPGVLPHFFTVVKQHGGLLAKGRVLGLQFDCLFDGDRYVRLGRHANALAAKLREALLAKGYTLTVPSPTNQIFVTMENDRLEQLKDRLVYGFWEKADETHTVIRLAVSWATTAEEIAALEALL